MYEPKAAFQKGAVQLLCLGERRRKRVIFHGCHCAGLACASPAHGPPPQPAAPGRAAPVFSRSSPSAPGLLARGTSIACGGRAPPLLFLAAHLLCRGKLYVFSGLRFRRVSPGFVFFRLRWYRMALYNFPEGCTVISFMGGPPPRLRAQISRG